MLAGVVLLACSAAWVARVLMRPPPPVTIIKEVEVAKPPKHRVLVARKDLPSGLFVGADAFEWREKLDSELGIGELSVGAADDAQDAVRELVGAALRKPLVQGDVLMRDMLVRPGEPGFIAAVLSPGMRAITIPTSAVSSNAGLVSAGDWVDVILSLERGSSTEASTSTEARNPLVTLAAQTILRRVRVLALNNNVESIVPVPADASAKESKARSQKAPHFETLTLEVTPEAAERLAVAKEVGTLQVALRSVSEESTDAQPVAARQVTRIGDATAMFKGTSGTSSSTVTVKTFQGSQQGTLSFNRAP
nr:Flp pilus assembly protein CpaB [Curvibacter sp. CHRR-16]